MSLLYKKNDMKKFRKKISIIVIVLAIMMLPLSKSIFVSAGSSVWTGAADPNWAIGYTSNDDTAAETFSISTAEELAQLAAKVNSGLRFENKTINLTDNIVLNDISNLENWSTSPPARSWTTIGGDHGTGNKPFSGTFNGQGHTISGIYINKTGTDSTDNYQGLFGLSYGTIDKVGVINSYIKGHYNSGSVVGLLHNGTVTNCYNEGTIVGTGNSIGGIVGWSHTSTVSNCYNIGTVSGVNMVGGVVGENQGSTISNCYNTGTVSGPTNVGGVTGINYGTNPTVTNCYYAGHNVGIGGNGASQTGTTPFVEIANNPLGTDKTTTITEQTTTAIRAAWSGSLGTDFTVVYSEAYMSSDPSKATVSGTTLTGLSTGNSTICGRTLTIYQNGLANGGFIGIPREIVVPTSMPLTVTTDGGGVNIVPIVVDVSTPANNTYSASQNLDFTLNFDQVVTVEGTPYIELNIGGSTVHASYVSGSGSSALVFRYSVVSGDNDSNGISVGALNLNSGTIKSNNNIAANLTLNSVGSTAGVLVATTLPSITIPGNITAFIGDKISGITVADAGYLYFVNAGQTATTYADLCNLNNNNLANQLNYLDVSPEDEIELFGLNVGVYDIYVVNINNYLVTKSDKTLTVISPYTNGAGTEQNPYWVTNAFQFSKMSIFENTSFIMKNDISLAGIANWTPIDFSHNKLDGNYHNITGLNIDNSSSFTGLFKTIRASEVRHLGIINANVKGTFAVGIFAGSVSDSHIEEVFTTGAVEGTTRVGGLIGNYSAADDTVQNCYSTATVTGVDYVGGLVGHMEASSIINSYSTGQVIVQDSSSSDGFGGLLGADNPSGHVQNDNTFVANYYDMQTSGQADSTGAAGKTTAEMKTTSTFQVGTGTQIWDFTNVWAISPTYNNGYPYLKGFYTEPPKTIEIIQTPAGINNADKLTIEPIGEAFDESVEVRINDDLATKKLIEDFIKSDGKIDLENANVFPLDISLYIKGTDTKVQPKDGTSVKITCPIPNNLLATKDSLKVVCVIDGKLTVLETTVVLVDGVYCVQFTANHFSPYALVVYNEKTTDNNASENPQTSDTITLALPKALLTLGLSMLGFMVVSHKKTKITD